MLIFFSSFRSRGYASPNPFYMLDEAPLMVSEKVAAGIGDVGAFRMGRTPNENVLRYREQ